MTYGDKVREEYFNWMANLVTNGRFSNQISYDRLLNALHNVDFVYSIPRDGDRAYDGMNLRYRFAYYHPDLIDAERYLQGRCTILEMMVALAVRCEETIMANTEIGDRTGQWFWGMIVNLGLGDMSDSRFDSRYVNSVLDIFLNRQYEPNGRGGLFTVLDRSVDMRRIEIWYQMNYYLDSIA